MQKKLNFISKTSLMGIILLTVLVIIEVIFRLFSYKIRQPKKFRNLNPYKYHSKLIIENVANAQIKESKTINGSHVYKDKIYTHDNHGRRINPDFKDKSRKKFLVLVGSSIVCGKGINDDETLSHYLNEFQNTYEVYNYSTRGWSSQHYLALFRYKNIRFQLRQNEGIVIIIISVNKRTGHVQRLIGSLDLCTPCWWMKSIPYFEESKEGSFAFKGSMDKVFPIKFYFYSVLQKSRVIRTLDPTLPRITDADYRKYARLLHYLKKEIHGKLNVSQVFFVNHPLSDINSTRRLKKSLQEIESLNFIDYSELIAKDKLRNYFFGFQWPYPKPKLNKIVAREIVKDLRLRQ